MMRQTRSASLPESHRVVACLGGDRTELLTRPRPEPGPGELLLRMRVSGLCGTDLFKLATGQAHPGMVLGHEVVGEVAAAGPGAPEYDLGTRLVVPHHVSCGNCLLCRRGSETMCTQFQENLLAPGGFADFIVVRERAAALAARTLPETLSDEAAVYMEPAACVLRGINRSGLDRAGVAVVQGAGSMGLLHLLVLRAAMPQVQVVMVDPQLERLELALKLGAQHGAVPGGDACEKVRKISREGVDAVFDTVGGAGPLKAALELIRKGGTVVLFAHAPESATAGFALNELFKYEKRVVGTYSGALEEQREIFDLLTTGRLDPRPLNTHRLKLEQFETGVALARERKALKVLFERA
jgi:L-iditol 2-dehydrogenase